MDFSMLAPEITSAQLHSGPGAEPLLAAAAAWETIALELDAAATDYGAAISELIESWHGPSSAAMTVITGRFVTWMSTAAAQAADTATRVTAAADAFDAALAAIVPPPVIAANRSRLAALLATNLLGRNAAAIAEVESEYAAMWVRNTTAMYHYAASAAAASRLTPLAEPGRPPEAAATAASGLIPRLLDGLTVGGTAARYEEMFAAVAAVSRFSTFGNASMSVPNIGMVQFKTFFKPAAPGFDIPASALGAGLRAAPPASVDSAARAVSAILRDANLVGRLSVPPSWATATPAIRLAGSGLPNAGVTSPASPVSGLLSAAALGSLAGGALGRPAPRIINATRPPARAAAARTACRAPAPVKLDRVIAQLRESPDSVQHWDVDQAGLDDLIEELSRKPGVHAVHLVKSESG